MGPSTGERKTALLQLDLSTIMHKHPCIGVASEMAELRPHLFGIIRVVSGNPEWRARGLEH